jgi:hypothetical protein
LKNLTLQNFVKKIKYACWFVESGGWRKTCFSEGNNDVDLIFCVLLSSHIHFFQEYKLFEQALKATPTSRWTHAGEMKPNGKDYASLDI